MFKHLIRGLVAVSLIASLAPSVASGGDSDELDTRLEVDIDQKSVGAILARGVKTAEHSCQFSDDRFFATEKSDEEKWQAYEVTDGCDLVLTHRWMGTLADAPIDLGVEDDKDDGIEKEETTLAPELTTAGVSLRLDILAATTCKEHRQRIYTYGGGGPTLDKLTRVENSAGICSNGSSAWIEFHSRNCYATDPPGGWAWVIDACNTSAIVWGPASYVYKTDHGAFHCSPPGSSPCSLSSPDGYYHSLYSRFRAWGSGAVTCDWWWGGQVVFGPKQQILLGC